MRRTGRKLKIEQLIAESEQQVASCRRMLEQSVARAEITRQIIMQCSTLVRTFGADARL
jgi:hypothetical protein